MKIKIAMFILALIAGSLIIVMLVGVHNSVNNHTSVRIAINEKWGLSIPKDAKVSYYTQTDENWFGEGSFYTVYNDLSVNDVVDSTDEGNVDKNIRIKKATSDNYEITTLLENIYDKANVSDNEKIGSYDNGYIYSKEDGSCMIVLEDPIARRLYIAENVL